MRVFDIIIRHSEITLQSVKPWGCSSLGRALEWHSRGKGFDPPHLHQENPFKHCLNGFFCFQNRAEKEVTPRAIQFH